MRVLVSGGAGYIGSVVTEELVRDGHEVVVLDNLSKGHRDAVVGDAAFVEGDVLDVAATTATLRRHRIEAVMHMAADSLVGESVTDPAKYYRNNLEGGLHLLAAMRGSGVGAIVLSSTAAVYGDPERQPIEETAPTVPTNPYGETKLAFERALEWHERAYGLAWLSLRYFNAAGATERNGERHDPETHLIPLVLQVAEGRRPHVTLFGDDYPTADGTCVRDYIHVADLARAHVLGLRALGSGGAPRRIYNLGCGGAGYSVREIIDVARRITGRPIATRLGPRRAGDPATLVASSQAIQRDLGWKPTRGDVADIVGSAWTWMEAFARR